MQFTYTVQYDDDYQPWGDPEVIAGETAKINAGEWAAYVVTVRAAGPVDAEESLHGCVVALTDTGLYHDVAAIQDAHLREVAAEMARRIASGYLSLLTVKRDEINAMIERVTAAA
jgi:hypothetical protein